MSGVRTYPDSGCIPPTGKQSHTPRAHHPPRDTRRQRRRPTTTAPDAPPDPSEDQMPSIPNRPRPAQPPRRRLAAGWRTLDSVLSDPTASVEPCCSCSCSPPPSPTPPPYLSSSPRSPNTLCSTESRRWTRPIRCSAARSRPAWPARRYPPGRRTRPRTRPVAGHSDSACGQPVQLRDDRHRSSPHYQGCGLSGIRGPGRFSGHGRNVHAVAERTDPLSGHGGEYHVVADVAGPLVLAFHGRWP